MTLVRPLVIIPTYNEAENIERILRRIAESLPEAGVLVVDDGSPDGTADLVKAASSMASPALIDGRNLLDPAAARAAADPRSVGRGSRTGRRGSHRVVRV